MSDYRIFLRKSQVFDTCFRTARRSYEIMAGTAPHIADIFIKAVSAPDRWLRHLVGEADMYALTAVDNILFQEFDYVSSPE